LSQEGQIPELELPEIFKKFKDHWVAIQVTKRDQNEQPLAGKVVANEVDRYRLRLKIVQYNDIASSLRGNLHIRCSSECVRGLVPTVSTGICAT